jgi:hypothetical protein
MNGTRDDGSLVSRRPVLQVRLIFLTGALVQFITVTGSSGAGIKHKPSNRASARSCHRLPFDRIGNMLARELKAGSAVRRCRAQR